MKQFPTIQKIDTAILYTLELLSSLSIILLAFGLIASMANVLTKGGVLSDSPFMQSVWAWTQCIAIDASVAGTIIRTFEYKANREYTKMALYALLSAFLLFTAAIVSNIESVQQTLNIALEKAYIHVFVPLEALIWLRSISIVLLIVAHAVRHVEAKPTRSVQEEVVQEVKGQQSEDAQEVIVMQEDEPIKQLPQPKRRARTKTNTLEENKQRVAAYLAEHQTATVREVAQALSIGTSTANKWMRKVRE